MTNSKQVKDQNIKGKNKKNRKKSRKLLRAVRRTFKNLKVQSKTNKNNLFTPRQIFDDRHYVYEQIMNR